ncbi:MAG: hypothetical protein GXO12_01980 [Epsilonproteobacteria bacterium]|nr:hypothetical protein [Campylobacterota bacterium]
MLNIQEEFLKQIHGTKEVDEIEKKIKKSAFELSKKKLSRLKDNKKREHRAIELLKSFIRVLKEENIENISTVSAVIEGISKAISYDKEQEIYEMITKLCRLEREIDEQKHELKKTLYELYGEMEKVVDTLEEDSKEFLEKALSDIKLKDVSMLGILKETVEEAILTVLEKQKDVEELINQITQNIVFQAIQEDDFSKERLMDISKTVLEVAVNIADEYQAYAKDILKGAVFGVKNGITKAIKQFNENLEFLPDEIRDERQEKILFEGLNIIDANSDFIDIIKQCAKKSNGISKKILEDLMYDIDSSLTKIIKITSDTKENILNKIEKLKESPKINELKKRLSQKITDLHIDKKIKPINKDDIENVAKESKKLGLRAWEVAKNAIDSAVKTTKESLHKNSDNEDK